MNNQLLLIVALLMALFYALTPGILLTIPQHSTNIHTPAAVHSLVFGIVAFFILHKMANL